MSGYGGTRTVYEEEDKAVNCSTSPVNDDNPNKRTSNGHTPVIMPTPTMLVEECQCRLAILLVCF